jgi:recombination protein RecA
MAKATKKEIDSNDKFEKAKQELELKYGVGSIVNGKDIIQGHEIISTGSIALDQATNCGGIPLGKLVEFMGQESSGKSSGALHLIAECQKKYPEDKVIYCDYEYSFEKEYATNIGVQVDNLEILTPECMEDGYNMIEALIKTGRVRLAIIDSHTASKPKKVMMGEHGDAVVGLDARINSISLAKLKPVLDQHKCTLIGISQIRQDIGSMGEVNKSTGGNSWKFYSDMRFKFAKIQTEKEKESNKTQVEVIKNKCAPPWGKAIFHLQWGVGIDLMKEVIDYACELELIKKGGSWYTLEGEHKFQGEEAVKEFFTDNQDYFKTLHAQVLRKLNPVSEPQPVETKE